MFLRRKKPLQRSGSFLRRKKPINKISKPQAREERYYRKIKPVWHKEHPYCEALCQDQGIKTPSEPYPHHKKGRFKDRLNKTEWWMAICPSCHNWIEENRLEARMRGWLLCRDIKSIDNNYSICKPD